MNLTPLNPVLDLARKHVSTVLLVVVVVVAVLVHFSEVRKLQKENVDLLNQVALKDKTVEEVKGVYEKRALEEHNVQAVLDAEKDQQLVALKDQLKKAGEQLDNATSVGLKWKQAYEGLATATEKPVPDPTPAKPGVTLAGREEVDFDKDFSNGFIHVSGYTRTNPAEAFVSVQNMRPLKLTLAISQDKQGGWHAYTTTSEENVGADIVVSAVNPSLRDTRWYERLGLIGSLGLGDGFLAGVGASVDLGHFEVGPQIWVVGNTEVSKFIGATVIWKPFAR